MSSFVCLCFTYEVMLTSLFISDICSRSFRAVLKDTSKTMAGAKTVTFPVPRKSPQVPRSPVHVAFNTSE